MNDHQMWISDPRDCLSSETRYDSYLFGFLSKEDLIIPPARKLLPRVRKPNLHLDRGQDSNPCAWRPLRSQSTHGSTVPRQPLKEKLQVMWHANSKAWVTHQFLLRTTCTKFCHNVGKYECKLGVFACAKSADLARNTQNSLYSHIDYTWKFNKQLSTNDVLPISKSFSLQCKNQKYIDAMVTKISQVE
ncbi:hypothetical protein E2C01_028441 [Portunus trituberculatus]|uniref:Uncharacterized protein n=1 Tax=Portunus trituberculatus TaxID=210409 RepID=A0A5B7EKM6_PORTR|nr:hypothetical protein [Portunus trituberculatus]